MRLMVNDYAGHPFQYDLSAELAARGHVVHHVFCSTNTTPHSSFSPAGVSVIGVSTGHSFEKYRPGRRLLDELRYGVRSSIQLRKYRPQALLASNMPVFALAVLTLTARLLGIRVVIWLQDFQAPIARASLGNTPATRTLAMVERLLLRSAHAVIPISEELALLAGGAGVPAEAIQVVGNWSPIDDLPLRPKANPWAATHGLSDRFVVLYSGTLGRKHRLEPLLETAAHLHRLDPDARLVVISEGEGAARLREEVDARAVTNLHLFPFQAWDDMPEVLAAADILLVTLAEELATASVPSKALTYLCAGRPILAALPERHAIARVLRQDAGAAIIAPDALSVRSALDRLYADSQLRASLGTSGRRYAEQHFDVTDKADIFEAALLIPLPTTSADEEAPRRVDPGRAEHA